MKDPESGHHYSENPPLWRVFAFLPPLKINALCTSLYRPSSTTTVYGSEYTVGDTLFFVPELWNPFIHRGNSVFIDEVNARSLGEIQLANVRLIATNDGPSEKPKRVRTIKNPIIAELPNMAVLKSPANAVNVTQTDHNVTKK